jgi:transcriptional regulator with XRE-family HTH domain
MRVWTRVYNPHSQGKYGMNKDSFAKSFGLKIKKLRKAKGLSQEELAESIDKTVDTISSIERGLSSPRIETTIELSKILDTPLHELFQFSELPAKDRIRAELLDEINNLLKSQSADLLDTMLEQTKQLVMLKEKLTKKRS